MYVYTRALTENTLKRALRYWIGKSDLPLEQVNDGWCDQFAELVVEKLGGETYDLQITGTPDDLYFEQNYAGHVWIVYKDKNYDCECVDGVIDWKDLPIFKK